MSDLMLKQFEAWAVIDNQYSIARTYTDLRYDEDDTEAAWYALQASRECLVIELPPEPEYPEDPEEAIDDSHMDSYHSAIRMRNACRDSIHAAGVKTK